jgi:hypothetical protein
VITGSTKLLRAFALAVVVVILLWMISEDAMFASMAFLWGAVLLK